MHRIPRIVALLALLPVVAAAPGCARDDLVPSYVCEAVPLTVVPPGRKLVIAHRGATRDFPENTEEALVAAAGYEANAVELDVVLTADGVLVVHHDFTLDRMTDCGGDLRGKTWDEVKDCKVEGKYALPRLDGLLPKLLGYRKVFVELKTGDDQAEAAADAVGKVIRDLLAYDRVVVTSYNLLALYRLKTKWPSPAIQIGFDGDGVSIPLATLNLGFQYMLMRYSDVDRCIFSMCEQMGVKLITYTVQTREDLFAVMSGLFREHAYGIMFDNVEQFTDDRDELKKQKGVDLPTRKSCEKGGGVWDEARWECAEPCRPDSCAEGEACDTATNRCEPMDSDVPEVTDLLARIDEMVRRGQRAWETGDDAQREVATADLGRVLAPESVYAARPEVLAEILFGTRGTLGALADAGHPETVQVSRPTARIVTLGGTEWFLARGEQGWALDHVTTW